MYTPNEKDSLPVFVYLHGGSWVGGDINAVDILCQNIAHDAESIVVSVEYYRLAPAHKFPVPIEDCCAAIQWVAENSGMLRVDKTRIAIGGDSAGGNIAASVAVMAQKFNNLSLAAQVLVYPVVDLTLTFKAQSYRDNAEGYCLARGHCLDSFNLFALRNRQIQCHCFTNIEQ